VRATAYAAPWGAELGNVLYRWSEAKVLYPKALELLTKCCKKLNESQDLQLADKRALLREEPQHSAVWDIKGRFQVSNDAPTPQRTE
jgi:hypothetical protein